MQRRLTRAHSLFDNIVSPSHFLNAKAQVRVGSPSTRPRLVEVVDFSTVATGRRLPLRAAPVPGEAIDSWREATAVRMDLPLGAVARALNLPIATRPVWVRCLSRDQLEAIEAATGECPAGGPLIPSGVTELPDHSAFTEARSPAGSGLIRRCYRPSRQRSQRLNPPVMGMLGAGLRAAVRAGPLERPSPVEPGGEVLVEAENPSGGHDCQQEQREQVFSRVGPKVLTPVPEHHPDRSEKE